MICRMRSMRPEWIKVRQAGAPASAELCQQIIAVACGRRALRSQSGGPRVLTKGRNNDDFSAAAKKCQPHSTQVAGGPSADASDPTSNNAFKALPRTHPFPCTATFCSPSVTTTGFRPGVGSSWVAVGCLSALPPGGPWILRRVARPRAWKHIAGLPDDRSLAMDPTSLAGRQSATTTNTTPLRLHDRRLR